MDRWVGAFGRSLGGRRVLRNKVRDAVEYLRSICMVAVQCLYSYPWVAAAGLMKALPRENQVKLTVSVPPSLHVLLRSWAQCEGRELTSVVLQCVELSVRQLKSSGSIPAGAIRNYELACEERLAASGLGGV